MQQNVTAVRQVHLIINATDIITKAKNNAKFKKKHTWKNSQFSTTDTRAANKKSYISDATFVVNVTANQYAYYICYHSWNVQCPQKCKY